MNRKQSLIAALGCMFFFTLGPVMPAGSQDARVVFQKVASSVVAIVMEDNNGQPLVFRKQLCPP
jgi:hypothetical protein